MIVDESVKCRTKVGMTVVVPINDIPTLQVM